MGTVRGYADLQHFIELKFLNLVTFNISKSSLWCFLQLLLHLSSSALQVQASRVLLEPCTLGCVCLYSIIWAPSLRGGGESASSNEVATTFVIAKLTQKIGSKIQFHACRWTPTFHTINELILQLLGDSIGYWLRHPVLLQGQVSSLGQYIMWQTQAWNRMFSLFLSVSLKELKEGNFKLLLW